MGEARETVAADPTSITLEHPPRTDRALAKQHDENFHVLSRFVPEALRDDFGAVYAFCRGADDIADEHDGSEESRERALTQLAEWGALVDEAASFARGERESPPEHAVFAPLAHTMRRRSLAAQPFHDLLSAFEQDQRVTRYETWEQLLDYCARSANPVGRIVLAMIHSESSRSEAGGALRDRAAMLLMSDAVCTALQLANFWQDVRRDLLDRNRVYLPSKDTGIDAEALRRWVDTPNDPAARVPYIRAMHPLVQRTRELFAQGHALPAMIPDRDLGRVVSLFIMGGERTLDKIEAIGCATLWSRPSLSKADKAALILRARFAAGEGGPKGRVRGASPFIEHALRSCARTTRREARNFYYGLRLTPEPKRSALYAVYAWMRDADDDADGDDRAIPSTEVALARIERRRARLRSLIEHDRLETAHHSWVGLAWALREYGIDPADLYSLLDGLENDANHAGFETRDDLRGYCERVASTVGRVCVSIWGVRDGAESAIVREKATARGVAFQLVNILRDVRRDFAAGRVYLPRETLAQFGVEARDVAEWKSPDANAALVGAMCAWARREFAVSDGLEGMVDPSCAPSMAAMTEIYAGVLTLIERDPILVACDPRASLSIPTKIAIMGRAASSRLRRASR